VFNSRPDLSMVRDLVNTAELSALLADPNASLTLFAPNNEAVAALLAQPDPPDLTDKAVATELLTAHANITQVLPEAEVLALEAVQVNAGFAQPVDAAAVPPTVGGAGIIDADVTADNGVIHVLNAVMPTQP
jgi:uncharacterized surface protein with fasciclin (FAS1) repeats